MKQCFLNTTIANYANVFVGTKACVIRSLAKLLWTRPVILLSFFFFFSAKSVAQCSNFLPRVTHNNVLCFGGNTGRIVIDVPQAAPYTYTLTAPNGSITSGNFNALFL